MRGNCRRTGFLGVVAWVLFLLLCASTTLRAEVSREKSAAVRANIESLRSTFKSLPENIRLGLSPGLSRAFMLGEKWDQIERVLDEAVRPPHESFSGPSAPSAAGVSLAASATSTQVSDPTQDLTKSRILGFSQFTSSTAWCGKNVVVGYFDTGSYLESYQSSGGTSLAGISRSEDAGKTFQDLGYLNPGPVDRDLLLGSPVVQCADADTFYYASLFSAYSESGATDLAITVSKSTDGGKTWGNPVPVLKKKSDLHIFDNPWMALDLTHPGRIYVTYTHFDLEGLYGTPNLCPKDTVANTIEVAKSEDGGSTWSAAPLVLATVCQPAGTRSLVQGSRVAVGPAGEVYAAWTAYGDTYAKREIDIRRSQDGGTSFSASVKVSSVTPIGAGDALQGWITVKQYPSLAVDMRAGSKKVYVAWSDGRKVKIAETFSQDGYYHYSDILIARSSDGGKTWTAPPVKVNQNQEPLPSKKGTDQFHPAIAVDKKGNVGACFYDRRIDANNFLMQRYCAYSVDLGATWKELRITPYSYFPFHVQDALADVTAIGDYDTLSADVSKANPGFLGSFVDSRNRSNMDVRAAKLSF